MNPKLKTRPVTTDHRSPEVDRTSPAVNRAKVPTVTRPNRRTSRWVVGVLAVILAATTVVTVRALTDDNPPAPTQSDGSGQPAFNSPGGTTLNIP